MTQSRAHWKKPNPQKQKQEKIVIKRCLFHVSLVFLLKLLQLPCGGRFMKCESNWWCLFSRLGAPEQGPDVLKAEPWNIGVLCGTVLSLALVVSANPSTSLGKELGRAGRYSYVEVSPKIQFEAAAFLLGSGLRVGPQVCMSFGLSEWELKASSEHHSGKLVVRLFFFFFLKPFIYSCFL